MLLIFLKLILSLTSICNSSYGMVKCVIPSCRTGYRPTKHEKEIIEAGGHVSVNSSVFRFPGVDRKEIRDKWIMCLKDKDTSWNPPQSCGVCELHFRPDDFYETTFRKATRQRKTLKPTAVPSVFDDSLR